MKLAIAIFSVIAVLSVLGILVSWSGPKSHAQSDQSKESPSKENSGTERDMTKEREDQGQGWRKYKEKIERNEKFITATSTIFIAAFTVLLAFATFFLWLATRDLVEDAKHNAERQLRAYVFHSEQTTLDVALGKRPRGDILVKNSGLTPATDVLAWSGIMSPISPSRQNS